jgi:RecA/RadA recombinase
MTNQKLEKINLDKVLTTARDGFDKKKEKSLQLQMSKGSQIARPSKNTDFVIASCKHWQELTGQPGIPFGRITQIAGRPDSGKSTHAMMFMKDAQDQDYIVILWDSENKFSKGRFDRHFKGSSDDLLCVNSRVILEGGDMLLNLIDSCMLHYPEKKILVVWDSVGGTIASGASAKNLRDPNQMAMEAKENGRVCKALVAQMEDYKNKETGEEKIAVLLINQTYANIGAPGQKESGGQKVEYFSSLILQLTRKSDATKQKNGKDYKVGIVTRAKVKKNHLFDGEDSIAELQLLITAGGISLFEGKKKKGAKDESEGEIVADEGDEETDGVEGEE